MKTTRDILIGSLVIAISCASALAISLPVAEDTFTSHAVLTAKNGKAVKLLLNTNQAALVKFDLSSLPPAFSATNIASARLRIYIVGARAPGDLVANLITSDWTEAVTTNTPMPTFDGTIIGAVPTAKILARHFVAIDVTSAVIAALNGSGSNFGFILRDTTGQTSIASKEGPSQGPAVELEIDANLAQNVSGGGTFPGSLNVGGDFNLAGFFRQGSETGTAEPAGRGIIMRRIQSTNSAIGSVVARTDTLTLERDGTPYGFWIVNRTNAGYWIAATVGVDANGASFGKVAYLFNDVAAGTNAISPSSPVVHFRCSFGDPSGLGHQTEVSLLRNVQGDNVIWTGTLISTYNQ